jgi:hypothetical protein
VCKIPDPRGCVNLLVRIALAQSCIATTGAMLHHETR